LFGAGCSLLIVSSWCFVMLANLNRHFNRLTLTNTTDILELYVGSLFGCFFSVVPMGVSYLICKFTVFLINYHTQDDSVALMNEFSRNQTFYVALHKFVSNNKSDLKLHVVNKFILQCKAEEGQLENIFYSALSKKEFLKEWLPGVGNDADPSITQSKLQLEEGELYSSLWGAHPSQARSIVRKFNSAKTSTFAEKWRRITKVSLKEVLSSNFRIFYAYFDEEYYGPENIAFFAYFAFFFVGLGSISFILFVPTTVCFLLLSLLYPFVELANALVTNNFSFASLPLLPLTLTLAYALAVLILLWLGLVVWQFQQLCLDILPIQFPPHFYDVLVVEEMESRLHVEIIWQELDVYFDRVFGMDLTLQIKSFFQLEHLNKEGLYGTRLNFLKLQSFLKIPRGVTGVHSPSTYLTGEVYLEDKPNDH